MECYACGRAAERRCLRCHRPYCQGHGGGARPFCRDCLSPLRAVPSGATYRGSLLALLVAAGLAIWLLVRPPAPPREREAGEPLPGPMRAAAAPAGSQQPTPTPPPIPTPTPPPTPTPALPNFVDYEVQPGDTLLGIAQRYPRPGVSALEQAQAIAFWNNIDYFSPTIRPGQQLKIPQ